MFPLKKQGKVAKEDARVKGALEVEVITYCPFPTPPFLSTELLFKDQVIKRREGD